MTPKNGIVAIASAVPMTVKVRPSDRGSVVSSSMTLNTITKTQMTSVADTIAAASAAASQPNVERIPNGRSDSATAGSAVRVPRCGGLPSARPPP
jgi:hypothetical protein